MSSSTAVLNLGRRQRPLSRHTRTRRNKRALGPSGTVRGRCRGPPEDHPSPLWSRRSGPAGLGRNYETQACYPETFPSANGSSRPVGQPPGNFWGHTKGLRCRLESLGFWRASRCSYHPPPQGGRPPALTTRSTAGPLSASAVGAAPVPRETPPGGVCVNRVMLRKRLM